MRKYSGTCRDLSYRLPSSLVMDEHALWANTAEQLRVFMDQASDLIEITSPDGKLLYSNPAWRRAFGFDDSDQPDRGSAAMVTPECADEYRSMLRGLLGGSTSGIFEGIFLSQQQRRLVLRVRATARKENGELQSITCIFQDLTAQRTAEDARTRLIETLDATTDFVAVANVRGRAEYINRAGRRMVGIGENDDVRSVGLSGIYSPAARQYAIEVALPAALRDGVWEGESTVLTREGQEVPVSVVVVAHPSSRGGVHFVSTIMRDISAQKRREEDLLESEERFRHLSNASLDGVIVSRNGVLLEANAAWVRLFRPPEGTDLKTIQQTDLVIPGDRDRVAQHIAQNRNVSYRCTAVRFDGTQFDAEIVASPTVYQGAPARVTVVRDITEWRRLDRLKSEFVSTVSHELRTPLTSIRGSLGLLEGGAAGTLSVQGENLIRIARTNSERLIRLINDLLDLDKIEAGKLELRTTTLSPAELVRVAVEGIQAMAKQYNIQVCENVRTFRSFRGDRDRLIQVLANLLSNAIKFSPSGSQVDLRVTDTEASRMRFAVENPGVGIAASDRQKLFERFQQLDSSDQRQRGGTGLGLAISKAIVNQHGGEIGVESVPNATTTFWFELPIGTATPVVTRRLSRATPMPTL